MNHSSSCRLRHASTLFITRYPRPTGSDRDRRARMARGRWLSDEERAKILQLHADGMSAPQIARRVQRGVKSIRRVLNAQPTATMSEITTSASVPEKELVHPVVTSLMRDKSRRFAESIASSAIEPNVPSTNRRQQVMQTERIQVERQGNHHMVATTASIPTDPLLNVQYDQSQHAQQDQIASNFVNIIPDDDDDDEESNGRPRGQCFMQPGGEPRPPRLADVKQQGNCLWTDMDINPSRYTLRQEPAAPRLVNDMSEMPALYCSEVMPDGNDTVRVHSNQPSSKRRKVTQDDKSTNDTHQQRPLQRALSFLQDTIGEMKNPSTGIFEERVFQLFVRFQADIRLVELERQQAEKA